MTQSVVCQLEPVDACARRAVKAISEQRLDDAAKHLSALSENTLFDRAWKFYLTGLLEWSRHNLPCAQAALISCIQLLEGHEVDGDDSAGHSPLAASAHELLGQVLTRQDYPSNAFEHHHRAYQLRQSTGTPDEQYESARSLGFCCRLLRRPDDSIQWYERARTLAAKLCRDQWLRSADVLSSLSGVHLERGQLAEALDTAREAYQLCLRHEPSSDIAMAFERTVASRLLTLGQALVESGDPQADCVLNEAISTLEKCRLSVLALGQHHENAANEISEKLDFAKRLASLINAEP